jgi:hypothetical protein
VKFSEAKRLLEKMEFKESSVYDTIKKLILRGEILSFPINSDELAQKLADATLKKVKTTIVTTYMKPFVNAGIVKTILVGNKRVWRGAWAEASKEVLSYEFPFPEELVKKLGKRFEINLKDLRLVWNRSGNCMAFLLRRIIEKAIYFAFVKQGMTDKLKDPSDPSKLVGLGKMIDLAASEKTRSGMPFLTPKIADHLKRSKFLGDAAAHDFLIDVYPKQVQLEINFVITALEALSKAW